MESDGRDRPKLTVKGEKGERTRARIVAAAADSLHGSGSRR
jgi:hypothetical protein